MVGFALSHDMAFSSADSYVAVRAVKVDACCFSFAALCLHRQRLLVFSYSPFLSAYRYQKSYGYRCRRNAGTPLSLCLRASVFPAVYSVRMASTGSTFDARRAGI